MRREFMNIDAATWTIFASLLTAGLAGSLHCVGMCGPILIGFSQVFERDGGKRALWRDFACYHAGRIWTYAMLGFVAGLLGSSLRHGSAVLGWQHWMAVAVSAVVVISGIALLGIIPGLKLEQAVSCGVKRFGEQAWFKALLHGQGATPRLLLGALMGLLPCGLVYAMLVVVATLPSPWLAAVGMIIFGIGTLPSLSVVIGAAAVVRSQANKPRWSAWIRGQGTRFAAVLLILTGAWMMARTLMPHDHHGDEAGHHSMEHDEHHH